MIDNRLGRLNVDRTRLALHSLKLVLQLLIALGAEYLAENRLSLICRGKEQFVKIALCNHRNLPELLPVYA